MSGSGSNFISEWFGHRIYPHVVESSEAIEDQRRQRCPFLSSVKEGFEECIKPATSRGVCTINSRSNGPRQDWLVCPYRAFDPFLMKSIARRLYRVEGGVQLDLVAAPNLSKAELQAEILESLDRGVRVLVYFDHKLGGEIQIPPTDVSPQMAFDTTLVEIHREGDGIALGRFAIVEIQTMDFHGSYRKAVDNLTAALNLHPDSFPTMVGSNQWWLSENIEGPNIANVFKRTFYQMMFKFEMALSEDCAGCALAIPTSVWGSWQRFLGGPSVKPIGESTSILVRPNAGDDVTVDESLLGPSWIYVFEFDSESGITPSPMVINQAISARADVLAQYALEEAPKGAILRLGATLYDSVRRRLVKYWAIPIR